LELGPLLNCASAIVIAKTAGLQRAALLRVMDVMDLSGWGLAHSIAYTATNWFHFIE
jgi:hypothetical protein